MEAVMVKTIVALFDGAVLRPAQPLELAPNTPMHITIETALDIPEEDTSFLRTARSLNLLGPPDWSENLEAFRYGRGPDQNG